MAFGGYNGIQWEMTPQIMQFSTLLFSVLLMGHMYLYMSLYVTIDEYRVVWETAKLTESTIFNKDWSGVPKQTERGSPSPDRLGTSSFKMLPWVNGHYGNHLLLRDRAALESRTEKFLKILRPIGSQTMCANCEMFPYLISPVMARLGRTGLSMASERSAVTMVQPAEGPSFGVAPSGTCRCTQFSTRNWLSPEPDLSAWNTLAKV